MIVSRAPVRISFGGGGTDLEAYYARFGGFVLSTAINRYCYVAASQPADGGIHLRSADSNAPAATVRPDLLMTGGGDEVPRTLPHAALAMFAREGLSRRGVSLTVASDVPSGTGLGSSSAMAVALIHALAGYLHIPLSSAEIAQRACQLEIEQLGMPIGKQDQYASAFGGLNVIEFACDGGVDVQPLALPERVRRDLRARLLLFSTGRRHDSSAILRQQRDDTERKPVVMERLHQIKRLGMAMRDALLAENLDGFGHLLDRAWCEKRQLSAAISNTSIDTWYFAARSAGALGGKITGAGGGGFLLLYAPPAQTHDVRAALRECGLRELPFDFAPAGVHTLAHLPGERPAWRLHDDAASPRSTTAFTTVGADRDGSAEDNALRSSAPSPYHHP